jgi:hypothetical protein
MVIMNYLMTTFSKLFDIRDSEADLLLKKFVVNDAFMYNYIAKLHSKLL